VLARKTGNRGGQVSWEEPFVISMHFIDMCMVISWGTMSEGVVRWVQVWRFWWDLRGPNFAGRSSHWEWVGVGWFGMMGCMT